MTRGIKHTFCLIVVVLGATALSRADDADRAAVLSGDKRITVNVDKGEITDALRLIAQQGGLNISIGPGVEGEVTVYLTDASLQAALEAVTVNNGFAYSVKDGIISVSQAPEEKIPEPEGPPPLITKVFTLRCQDAARVKEALKYALTQYGKMEVLNENSESRFITQSLSELSGEFGDNQSGVNGGGRTSNLRRSGNIPGQLGGLGGQQGAGGFPALARNARFLIVTDVKENMADIADLIADIDRLPPQVLVEARIVEMTTQLQRNLGIDWDVNVLANGPILNTELPLQGRAGFASGTQIRRTVRGGAQSSVGLALGTVDFSRFLALLRVHESDNAVRLLANPRLLVFNNTSASILVGERYPILEATITDFGTVTEAFDTYIPVGIQLEVMPTIMNDGRISLFVHPVTSSLGDNVIGTTGLAVRRITTRELNTRVIMKDGQTVVLGGLISDRKTRQANKVPGLGDLPGLSWLFRQENPTSERVDLLVFLTVNVERGDEINERDREVLEKYRPHFKQIQKLQDVPLHFEVPTEFEPAKPMFGDPPEEPADTSDEEITVEETTSGSSAKAREPASPRDQTVTAARFEKGSSPRFKSRVGNSVIRVRRGETAAAPTDHKQASVEVNPDDTP